MQAGRPETIEGERSLLQAAGNNAKQGFNHHEDLTHEEVTGPLRQLQEKGDTYRTNLAPYDPKRKTHLM